MSLDLQTNKERVILTSLSYLLSVITGVLGFFIWIMLRETLMLIVRVSSINSWSVPAIDNFSFLLFGILWLITVFFSQSYYSKGVSENRVWRNFFLITSIQLLLLVICQITPILLGLLSLGSRDLLLIGTEIIIGFVLIFYVFKWKN